MNSNMENLQSTTILANGVKMPWLGLGVYKVEDGQEVVDSVKYAIKAGYKSIDTAKIYENEEGVGQAIKESGVSRGRTICYIKKCGMQIKDMTQLFKRLKQA